VAVDKNTGEGSVVGNIGFGGNSFGADFSGDTLVGAAKGFTDSGAKFFAVDTATGSRTDFLTLPDIDRVDSITFAAPTTLYFTGSTAASPASSLYALDIPTTTMTKVGDLSARFNGLDFGLDCNLYGVSGTCVYIVNAYTAAETMLFDAASDTDGTGWSGFTIDKRVCLRKCSFLCRRLGCC